MKRTTTRVSRPVRNTVCSAFPDVYAVFIFCLFIYVSSPSGVRDKRRIWVRCPFCWTVTNTPAAHLDARVKGCRRSLQKSGLERSAVIQRMRDEAYAFTSMQTISPTVLEKISARQGTTGTTGCMMELCRHLNVKVSKSASHGRTPLSNRATRSIVDLTELSGESGDDDLYNADDRNDDDDEGNPANFTAGLSFSTAHSPRLKVSQVI